MTVSDNEHEIIRNPKVYVVGYTEEQLVEIKKVLKEKRIDLVTCQQDADASVTPDWIIGPKPEMVAPDMDFASIEKRVVLVNEAHLFCGHPLANIGSAIPEVQDCKDTSFD